MPIALAIAGGCAGHPAGGPAAIASSYSRAFVAGDCDTLERLSSDSVRRRAGGSEKLKELLCGFVASLQSDGYTIREEVAGDGPEFRDGATRLVLLPTRRTGTGDQGTIVVESTYAVHSSDGGRSWNVLDLGCIDERWLREVAPTYGGSPPLSRPKRTFVPKQATTPSHDPAR